MQWFRARFNGRKRQKMDAGDGQEAKSLEEVCAGLLDDSSPSVKWSWDDRFQGVLSQFAIEEKEQMLSVLVRHLGIQWDSGSIGQAPIALRKFLKGYGGVRHGQLVFAEGTLSEVFVVGMWWPWDDNRTISLRVVLVPYEENGTILDSTLDSFMKITTRGSLVECRQ